jgi:hypothetical protein
MLAPSAAMTDVEGPGPAHSGGLGQPSGSEQLQQVVPQTHQAPLCLRRFQSSKREAPKPSRLLDLPEDRG